jgi:hypothetical protein
VGTADLLRGQIDKSRLDEDVSEVAAFDPKVTEVSY